MPITVAEICRYPVKGLSAQSLSEAALRTGEGLAGDRRFAIAHEAGDFNADDPAWLSKRNFLTLMTDEKLAELGLIFDEDRRVLALSVNGERVCGGAH